MWDFRELRKSLVLRLKLQRFNRLSIEHVKDYSSIVVLEETGIKILGMWERYFRTREGMHSCI